MECLVKWIWFISHWYTFIRRKTASSDVSEQLDLSCESNWAWASASAYSFQSRLRIGGSSRFFRLTVMSFIFGSMVNVLKWQFYYGEPFSSNCLVQEAPKKRRHFEGILRFTTSTRVHSTVGDWGTDRWGIVGTWGGRRSFRNDSMAHLITTASGDPTLGYIVSLRVNCALKRVLA